MLIRYLFDMNILSLFFTRPSSKSFSENVNISKQESSQLNMDDTASANEPTEQILNQNNTAAQSRGIKVRLCFSQRSFMSARIVRISLMNLY